MIPHITTEQFIRSYSYRFYDLCWRWIKKICVYCIVTVKRNWQWGRLRTKLYDKRDNFYFPIVNFPLYVATPTYGVYISQLIRYSRACGSYQNFIDRGLLLTRKLLNQGFLLVKLKSSLRKLKRSWLPDLSVKGNMYRYNNLTEETPCLV